MFFNKFDDKVRKLFNEDNSAFNVLSYIIFNTNYQNAEYEGLKAGECYISYNVLEEVTGLTRKVLQRCIKKLEAEKYIIFTYKSNSKKSPSKVRLMDTVEDTVEDTVKDTVEDTVQSAENTGVKPYLKTVEDTVKDTVKYTVEDTLSINKSKNKSKKQSNYKVLEWDSNDRKEYLGEQYNSIEKRLLGWE